jgi:hypothetical protein
MVVMAKTTKKATAAKKNKSGKGKQGGDGIPTIAPFYINMVPVSGPGSAELKRRTRKLAAAKKTAKAAAKKKVARKTVRRSQTQPPVIPTDHVPAAFAPPPMEDTRPIPGAGMGADRPQPQQGQGQRQCNKEASAPVTDSEVDSLFPPNYDPADDISENEYFGEDDDPSDPSDPSLLP